LSRNANDESRNGKIPARSSATIGVLIQTAKNTARQTTRAGRGRDVRARVIDEGVAC